jgi:two-component system sensor histidine kinase TctE
VKQRAAQSLRRVLLTGILLPVGLYIGINTVSLYNQSFEAITLAYDRTLLASAKSIAELLDVSGYDAQAQVRVTVPYAALEAFEADNKSRMVYRVSTLDGALISGFSELPAWKGRLPDRTAYAALVDFYNDQVDSQPVRVAVLLQPVASANGRGMAVIQVAETLELREALTRRILFNTLWRQAVLVAVIVVVAVVVVQRATRPVRQLSAELQARPEGDLSPLTVEDAPRELTPLVEATNQVMGRLQHLLDHQKRFVRDASHQLRTPLAVLKTQIQSAQRGDVSATQALDEISVTVDHATQLANHMLSLAKVEQLRNQSDAMVLDLAPIVREVALDLSALVAAKNLDFEISTQPALIKAHEWSLRELSRNLLHNAIKHTPQGGSLTVQVRADTAQAHFAVQDSGPGISADLRARLYQPFSSGDVRSGSGLGLAICHEIVMALGGHITLDNRLLDGQLAGLDANVRLPIAQNLG